MHNLAKKKKKEKEAMAKANEQRNFQVAVVMVPLPAQGHLNQLLQFSRLISSYNKNSKNSSSSSIISVHFVSTSTHNRQAKLRVHGFDPNTISNIHFHDFQIPSFESPPPNPYSPIKFPSHLQPSFDASRHLRKPVTALLGRLSAISRRVVVIHDSLVASVVQDFVSFPNVESYAFRSISAFSSFLFFCDVIMGRPKSLNNNQNHDRHDDVILQQKDIPTLEACFTEEFEKFMNYQQQFLKFSSGSLYNSSRVIEGKFLDLLEKDSIFKRNNKKIIWAIGPLNPVVVVNTDQERKFCLLWLDKQPPKSVLFVSFGTTTSLTNEQIKELAVGLERSGVKFIWALREADKGDIFTTGAMKKNGDDQRQLPKGYEERVKNRGIIVRDWAPQLEIIRHPSTGGFISHCGWNSCMESITNGVPIAAWPMHSDQPRNSVLITKVLKVGIVLREWGPPQAKEGGDGVVVKSSAIESAVKLLMESKEGAEVRRRAEELGISVRQSVEEGGVTRKEMDLFVAHITRC